MIYEASGGEFSPKKVRFIFLFTTYFKDAFIVYTISTIEKRINEKVNEIKDLLGMNPDQAIIVLRHFKWNMDKI